MVLGGRRGEGFGGRVVPRPVRKGGRGWGGGDEKGAEGILWGEAGMSASLWRRLKGECGVGVGGEGVGGVGVTVGLSFSSSLKYKYTWGRKA